jgi:hypothetical protein
MQESELIKEISVAVDGLIYISETDAPIFPFTGCKSIGAIKESLLAELGLEADTEVEERGFDEMFARFVTIKEWFNENQRGEAVRFQKLKTLLESNLTDLRVFKIGQIRRDIFFIGLDQENRLVGIRTSAVET